MANPYQKKVQQRKIAYFVAILVLFSVALWHRRQIVEPMAYNLQLRETARGEVELTSSAVRLLMTGSRGMATTILWSAAIEKQKKHEWNEVELLVSSITKLQPNFITPWLFQSWNLAFNVSVECDRPRDKYYYVTRGLELLAEGERRNQGSGIFPGHPEIRQTLGIFYLRKIGLSDEKTTMRCLLDLSCIDPLKRNPAWFKDIDTKGARREVINRRELARFCQDNPRLVRRLREGLEYTSEKQIIDFLEKNRDVPNRFEPTDWARLPTKPPEQRQSRLKAPAEQFPTLPPAREGIATNPANYELSSESNDVFLMARSWVEYSQEPLPPSLADEKEVREKVKAEKRYRLPKAMALILFRGYPARCQAYIANEGLEDEGWFDEEGWVVTKWFDNEAGLNEGEFRVGTERKYHAQPAWERAAQLYHEYGRGNDLLFTPEVEAEFNKAAEPYRKRYQKQASEVGDLRADDRRDFGESWLAHHRLIWNVQNRGMSNFDNHYWAAMAERTRDCVTARKLLHRTETYRKIDFNPELGLETFEQAWPFWVNVYLQNPKFASQSMEQEDLYEYMIKSISLTQNQRSGVLRPVVTGIAQMAHWPYPPFDILLDQRDKRRIFPIRNVRGLLDWIQVPKLPEQDLQQTRMFLAVWPAAPAGYPTLLQSPPIWNLMLTRTRMRDDALPTGWSHLIEEENVQAIRDRVGVNKR